MKGPYQEERSTLDAPVPGKSKIENQSERLVQKRYGEYRVKGGGRTGQRDMESEGLKEDDPLDRKKWTNDIHDHCDDPR